MQIENENKTVDELKSKTKLRKKKQQQQMVKIHSEQPLAFVFFIHLIDARLLRITYYISTSITHWNLNLLESR